MAYLIGYLSTPFIMSFLIVYFGIAKRYEKKHGKKYSKGKCILYTILIGLALLIIILSGKIG